LKIKNCFLPVAHCVEQINGSLSHRNVSLSFEGVNYRLLWKENLKKLEMYKENDFITVSYEKKIWKKFEMYKEKDLITVSCEKKI
jgi:hypothetical protein